jgi:hypothetical protein
MSCEAQVDSPNIANRMKTVPPEEAAHFFSASAHGSEKPAFGLGSQVSVAVFENGHAQALCCYG